MSDLCHLGQQRSRPAATTKDGIGRDTALSHSQNVNLVASVQGTSLLPAQRELHELPVSKRAAVQLQKASQIPEPLGQLMGDTLASLHGESPVGDRGVEPHPFRGPDETIFTL
jgi:hypothetical protein